MADDEIPGKDAADDLDPAFDSIDETMKDMARREVTVTPEALADIVNDAVTKAITAYEQSRLTGDPAPDALPTKPSSDVAPLRRPANQAPAPRSHWRKKIDRLKDDMGLDEIKFDGPRPEPVEVVVQRELRSQMGVNDFKFEDAPGPAAEPDAPTRIEADAMAGWATPGEARQPRVPLEVNDIADFAPPADTVDDAREDFDWVAAELARTNDEPEPAPREQVAKADPIAEPATVLRAPVVPVERVEPVEPVEPDEPVEPVALAHSDPGDTLSSLANWFRSALSDRPQPREREPEPVAMIPESEPAAVEPLPAPPAPPPPVIAAAPVAARPQPERVPATDQRVAVKSVTPDEGPPETRFTFDPILPVPPRLPREPEQPAKKINKRGTFL